MKLSNLPNGALRTAECGLVYEEVLSGAAGTIYVAANTTLRIRATASTTVTIDGRLAVTMAANEILVLNVGDGVPALNKTLIAVVFSGTVYCQVARAVERPKPSIA